MLVGIIFAIPITASAADAAEIVQNGVVCRTSESEAEVSFYPTSGDFSVDWQYYYVVFQQNTEKNADEVISGGAVSDFDENSGVATFDVTDLAEGVKYIHIVLVQKDDTTQVSNVLKLTIPEYVPLTIVPSADGCELDGDNTLTVAVGTTVTFTTNESGCGMDYKEGSKVGPDLEFVGDEGFVRSATFLEVGSYSVIASIDGKTAECTVIVVEELHQHSYSSEWIMDDVGHWHACECGDMTDYADHEYEGQDCEDGEKHRLICRYCGFQYRTYNLTSVFDHEYDNDCDSDCNVCGYERTVAPHYGTSCDICGWTFARSVPTNLRWDTSNGTVAVWDAVDGAANYIVKLYKKDIITLHLLSYNVSDTSFEFDLTSLSAGSYYFTVRATFDDIKSESATSNDILTTSGGTAIVIGGVSVSVDSIDGTAYIVGREDIADGSISEVDLSGASGSTDLVIDQSKIDPNADKVTVKFDGTQAEMNNDALQKILDNLGDGDALKISVEQAGSEVLPDSLTEKEPFEDDAVLFDSDALTSAVIFTEQELLDLGVISANDEEITWEELKYLYHYMTITELKSLVWFIEDFLYNTDPQVQVWLAEMIERDTIKPLNMQELMDMADLTDEQWELLADEDLNDPTIGELRQAGLTVEQMRKLYGEVRILIGELNDNDKLSDCNELLGWLDDAIAEKNQENKDTPTYINTSGTNDGINPIFIGAVDVNIGAVKADGTTTPIAIKADRSDAVAWSTNVSSAALEEMLAMLGAATTEDVVSNIKAYKVLENGTLEARASKVTVNADGTLTLSAMSDGNSTYVFLYEPSTVTPEPEVPNGLSTGAIVAIVVACVAVLAGGCYALYRFALKKKNS